MSYGCYRSSVSSSPMDSRSSKPGQTRSPPLSPRLPEIIERNPHRAAPVLTNDARAFCDHLNVAHSDEDDLALKGWDVLAVGQRQAWPFVTFAAPTDERSERTLWIDTDFAVVDGAGREVAGTALS